MIVLDTHIWIWWVDGSSQLTPRQRQHVVSHAGDGLGVSVISCWEVAKLVEMKRLVLSDSVTDWIAGALNYPGVRLLSLTPKIAIESTQLPGSFHRDPADQIIVATARVLDCPLLTADSKILQYPHAKKLT